MVVFDAVLFIAARLALKVKCTAWLGTAYLVLNDCFCSQEGVKFGLDFVIVLLILAVTIKCVNGSAMQPLTTCDKNSLELFGVLKNITWRSVSMLQALHVHLNLSHLWTCSLLECTARNAGLGRLEYCAPMQ